MIDSPQTQTLRTVWSSIAGLKLHALVSLDGDPSGQRPPLLFVHGLGVSSRYMIPTIRQFTSRYRVYAPDLPGFGFSQKPPRPMSVPQLSQVLHAWIQQWQLGKSIFICNSMGCQVAIDLAIHHPPLIDRLILSGPTMEPTAPSAFTQILRLLRDSVHEKPSLVFVAGVDYIRAGPLRVLETLRLAVADHVEDKLPRVMAICLLVRGSNDPVAPQTWVENMTAKLPSARMAVIENAGHAVNYSAAIEFAALVQTFIDEPRG
jgi:2-hydroxy-6-oxonona-2,4-dienedioate hydrolase